MILKTDKNKITPKFKMFANLMAHFNNFKHYT